MKSKINMLLIGCMITGGTLMGVTYHVAPASVGGDDGHSGADWTVPKASISNALAQTDVTEILVSNGTYVLTTEIVVNKAVTIKSWNNGEVDPGGTVIDGNNQCRCFNVGRAEAVIDGFTIRNGFNSGSYARGGGVYMTAGMVTNCLIVSNTVEARQLGCGGGGVCLNGGGALWNCRVADNVVTNLPDENSRLESGGGVLVNDSGSIANSTICDNKIYNSRNGGGITLYQGGDADNCVVSNNYAHSGGGIYMTGGTNNVLRNCTVVNNVAGWDGGGVYLKNGLIEGGIVAANECKGANAGGGGICAWSDETNMVFVRNVSVISNTASSAGSWGGGGVTALNAWIEHCLISSNTATVANGGGVFVWENSAVINCRIIANQAKGVGGGIYCRASSSSSSVIRNCLIVSNIAKNRFGGGIHADKNTNGDISNCTVVDNEVQGTDSQQRGAGILVIGTNNIFNCLVWSNRWTGTASDEERDVGMYPWLPGGDFAAQSNSVHYCCSPRDFNGARGNITTPPVFVDVAGGDYRLAPGSGGINAGTNMLWMSESGAVDLDGNPRIDRFSHQVDIGCYERLYQGVLLYIQ